MKLYTKKENRQKGRLPSDSFLLVINQLNKAKEGHQRTNHSIHVYDTKQIISLHQVIISERSSSLHGKYIYRKSVFNL